MVDGGGSPPNCSLAADKRLRIELEEFNNLVQTKIDATVDSLERFKLLASGNNTQLLTQNNRLTSLTVDRFVENKVEDDDSAHPESRFSTKVDNVPQANASKHAQIEGCVQSAVKSAFELISANFKRIEIPADNFDEGDDPMFQPRPLFEPFDENLSRRLPLIIGSAEWRFSHDALPSNVPDSNVNEVVIDLSKYTQPFVPDQCGRTCNENYTNVNYNSDIPKNKSSSNSSILVNNLLKETTTATSDSGLPSNSHVTAEVNNSSDKDNSNSFFEELEADDQIEHTEHNHHEKIQEDSDASRATINQCVEVPSCSLKRQNVNKIDVRKKQNPTIIRSQTETRKTISDQVQASKVKFDNLFDDSSDEEIFGSVAQKENKESSCQQFKQDAHAIDNVLASDRFEDIGPIESTASLPSSTKPRIRGPPRRPPMYTVRQKPGEIWNQQSTKAMPTTSARPHNPDERSNQAIPNRSDEEKANNFNNSSNNLFVDSEDDFFSSIIEKTEKPAQSNSVTGKTKPQNVQQDNSSSDTDDDLFFGQKSSKSVSARNDKSALQPALNNKTLPQIASKDRPSLQPALRNKISLQPASSNRNDEKIKSGIFDVDDDIDDLFS